MLYMPYCDEYKCESQLFLICIIWGGLHIENIYIHYKLPYWFYMNLMVMEIEFQCILMYVNLIEMHLSRNTKNLNFKNLDWRPLQ